MQDINPGTAVDDTWSDPMSQYLAYTAAYEVYRFLGKEGFIHPDRMPKAGGYISGRNDWISSAFRDTFSQSV